MRTTRSRHYFRCVLPLLITVLVPLALSAQSQECTRLNATLRGAYVSHGTGSVGGAPIAIVGITTYDGQGGFQLTATVNINGTVIKPPTGTGTYTVNRDCSGSQTVGSSHYDFVVTPDGSKVTYISTDPGAVITVISERLDHQE
jgi:hypothetical protein